MPGPGDAAANNRMSRLESNPRVLFIAPQPFLEWRGSPLRVYFSVLALAELGFTVDLLVMPFGDTPDGLPESVTLHRPRNRFGRRGISIGPSAWKALYDLLLIVKARRLLSQNRYVAIHGVEEAGAIAGLLGRSRKLPVIFEKHSDPASYRRGMVRNLVMAAYARIERYAIRRAAAVIVTGPGLKKQVLEAFPDQTVHAIADMPSSLESPDDAEAARLRHLFAPGAGERLAAYAGSFALYQGITLLFDAIPETLNRFPAARFLIIGGAPAEIAHWQGQLDRLGVGARVTFAGRIPPKTLPHYLRAADVLLSPRAAGSNTPLKILDYLKAGRPIVAADCEANRLILDETVALMPPPTATAFAEAIAALMRDDPRREQMGQNAQTLMAQHYSYACFKSRLAECYAPLSSMPQP